MPYNFKFWGGEHNIYTFETEHKINYAIKFKPTGYIFEEYIWSFYTYEMVIEIVENLTGKQPPLDKLIPPTIALIFEDFLQEKEKITIYTCETADGKHQARARKFDSWFKDFNPDFFLKIDRFIPDGDLVYYNSLIIRQDNPFKLQIIEAFEVLIQSFEDGK